MKRFLFGAVAVALVSLFLTPGTSHAQRGGRGGSWGGSRGGWGGGNHTSWGVSVGGLSFGTGGYGRYGYGGYGYGGYGYGYPRYGYSNYGYDSGYYSPSYTYDSYYSTPSYTYSEPSVVYSTPSAVYQTGYDTGVSSQGSSGTIVVHLPANAELSWNGTPSSMTGSERRFGTLPLGAEGATHQFTARWMGANGQMVSQSRQVKVMPGQVATVDFMQQQAPPAPAATIQQGQTFVPQGQQIQGTSTQVIQPTATQQFQGTQPVQQPVPAGQQRQFDQTPPAPLPQGTQPAPLPQGGQRINPPVQQPQQPQPQD